MKAEYRSKGNTIAPAANNHNIVAGDVPVPFTRTDFDNFHQVYLADNSSFKQFMVDIRQDIRQLQQDMVRRDASIRHDVAQDMARNEARRQADRNADRQAIARLEAQLQAKQVETEAEEKAATEPDEQPDKPGAAAKSAQNGRGRCLLKCLWKLFLALPILLSTFDNLYDRKTRLIYIRWNADDGNEVNNICAMTTTDDVTDSGLLSATSGYVVDDDDCIVVEDVCIPVVVDLESGWMVYSHDDNEWYYIA